MTKPTRRLEVAGGPAATRETAELVETAGFDDSGRLLIRTVPRSPSIGTVVFASSLFAELQQNYRREVLLSRAAAAAGFTAVRVHYRGVGNSIGPPVTPTLDTMADDITDVIGDSGDGPVAIVATRLGALAAARVRRKLDVPIALWEPVLDGGRWVEEVVKACVAREVAKGGGATADEIRGRWATDGAVFALGEVVPAVFVDEVADTSLLDMMTGSAPVLLIQMARSDRVRPAVERARSGLADRGIDAEVLSIVGHQVWWLKVGGDQFVPIERQEATTVLNQGVLDWLKRSIT
ncbi:MAG: hypothetical protein OEV40_02865 [Acidimicrobiia bacterium]|nr:hypothetical protein [Acidimicrobiia bacterium]